MSDLQAFAAHCRAMSTAKHTVDCVERLAEWRRRSALSYRLRQPKPECTGCVTDTDRALWTRLADEADAFLAREPEPDLFGARA